MVPAAAGPSRPGESNAVSTCAKRQRTQQAHWDQTHSEHGVEREREGDVGAHGEGHEVREVEEREGQRGLDDDRDRAGVQPPVRAVVALHVVLDVGEAAADEASDDDVEGERRRGVRGHGHGCEPGEVVAVGAAGAVEQSNGKDCIREGEGVARTCTRTDVAYRETRPKGGMGGS